MTRKKKLPIGTAIVVAGLLILQQTGFIKLDDLSGSQQSQSAPSSSVTTKIHSKDGVNYGTVADEHPSESLAKTVLTPEIKKQLKSSQVSYNQSGAFIVNNNQTNLDALVKVAPYVQLSQLDSHERPGMANAFLSKSSRQYQSRSETGNSQTVNPVGWQQVTIGGRYHTLYNRGHLIGYALAGNIRSFDSSEANKQNIATQTAWANQSSNGNSKNTGQNYYETLIRRALDRHQNVRYRVTPLYSDNNLVPSGNHLEAKSSDGKLQFNVFIPNVQPGVEINYATGASTTIN